MSKQNKRKSRLKLKNDKFKVKDLIIESKQEEKKMSKLNLQPKH